MSTTDTTAIQNERIENINKMMDCEIRFAEQEGKEAIANIRSALERALRELASHEERFDEFDAPGKKADVLGWIIGSVTSNILGNTRMDLVSNAASKLRSIADRQQTLRVLLGDADE